MCFFHSYTYIIHYWVSFNKKLTIALLSGSHAHLSDVDEKAAGMSKTQQKMSVLTEKALVWCHL